jgi:hypothetical protein
MSIIKKEFMLSQLKLIKQEFKILLTTTAYKELKELEEQHLSMD